MDLLLQATRRAERDHFWFRGFRWFVSPLIARATAGRARPSILDCGCGTGGNLALLGRFGRAHGLDVSFTGLRFARASGASRIARASAACLPFAGGSFDLTTSFDVLYSLEESDERRAVREMFRVLRPGGYAIVNVAALNLLRGNHSVLSHEVRRYTPATLRALLEHAGFRIERLTFTNATLMPLMLPVRLFQRVAGLAPEQAAETDIRVPAAPLNALLSALLAAEARLLRFVNMPVGSSLLCLARKPEGIG